MRIIGCDLHARQQTLAMLDTTTGEVVEVTLKHEADNVREFYSSLPGPVRVGIEATGSMPWFLNLMEELGIECLVGHPAQIRAAEPRKQKHDRRDADLILKLLAENRFADFVAYLEQTERAIGISAVSKLFRPPGGVAWPNQLRLAQAHGYKCVLGCAYPHDPIRPPVWYMRWLVGKNLVPGTIVILHDGISDPSRSIEALPHILTAGRKKGLRFTSIGALVREATRPAETS